MSTSIEQCRLQQLKHGWRQFGKGRYDAAAVSQKLADGIGLDADAVGFHTQAFRLADGVFAGLNGIGHTVGQDKDDLPILCLRIQGLQHPPEGRGQRCATGSADSEGIRDLRPVADQRKDGRHPADGGKDRHRRVDALDALQCLGDGIAALAGQLDGQAAHAAAAIQEDVHGGVQAGLDGFTPEDSRVAHAQTVQARGM